MLGRQVDERALRDIMEMGFNREAARQALMDNNNNLEVALNSLLTGSSGSRPAVPEYNKPQPRGSYAKTPTRDTFRVSRVSARLVESM